MRKRKLVLFLVLVLIICVIILPYVRVEILTMLHKDEFATEYTQTNMVDDIEYLKVMEYSDQIAKVYYVIQNHEGAELITFERREHIWTMVKWESVWSKTGSASEFIWPYYR